MKANAEDLEVMLKIQKCCYILSMNESKEVFESIVKGNLCFVVHVHGETVGYLLAHYWHDVSHPPRLHEKLVQSGHTLCCFVHDLAIKPQYRGKGYARKLLMELKSEIGNMPCSLVSVNGTADFWQIYGFENQNCGIEILSTYGDDAKFMLARHMKT